MRSCPPTVQEPFDGNLWVLIAEQRRHFIERHLFTTSPFQKCSHGLASAHCILACVDDATKRVSGYVITHRIISDRANVKNGLARRHVLDDLTRLLVASRIADGQKTIGFCK